MAGRIAPARRLQAGPAGGRAAGSGTRERARRGEVRAIAALRPQATTLLGAAATSAAARAALGAVGIAHLAAHGRHQAENALFSTLELADGPMLGYDLQQLPRTPAMVVLSCCDLGLTDIRPGDETLGMVTALLSAGSATVIANVARVADDTAADTMISYHRAIAAGQLPAGALAQAVQDATGFVCFGAG